MHAIAILQKQVITVGSKLAITAGFESVVGGNDSYYRRLWTKVTVPKKIYSSGFKLMTLSLT